MYDSNDGSWGRKYTEMRQNDSSGLAVSLVIGISLRIIVSTVFELKMSTSGKTKKLYEDLRAEIRLVKMRTYESSSDGRDTSSRSALRSRGLGV